MRPRAVTVLGWLFIAAGSVGFLYHLSEVTLQFPPPTDVMLACFVRLLAVIGGVFALRGHDWARWLLGGWMAYHIALSFFHSPVELLLHVLLFGVIAYFLFRREASIYFRH